MQLDLNKPEYEPILKAKLDIIENFNPNYLEVVEVLDIYNSDMPMFVYKDDVEMYGIEGVHQELRELVKTDNLIFVAEKISDSTVGVFVINKKATQGQFNKSNMINIDNRKYVILYK